MVAHRHYATITTNRHLEDASGLGRWSSAAFLGGRDGKPYMSSPRTVHEMDKKTHRLVAHS